MQGRSDQSAPGIHLDRKDELTVAEEQLISLLRHGAGASTTFTIVVRKQRDGRFFVSQSDAARAIVPSFGGGGSFEEAWQAAGRFSQPSVSPDRVLLTLDGELSRALDTWIARQPQPETTRGEAVSRAIREWLTGLGFLARRPHHGNTH